jgi:predicted transposase/invertase (TIGR01784 family)
MEEYQKSLKDYWDEYANITTAKEEGREEGRQEGIMIGEEKGIKIGEEKGRQERDIEIAHQMKLEGLSIELIIKLTGLSREEVERL